MSDYGFALYHFFVSECVSKVNYDHHTTTMYNINVHYIYREVDE